MSPQAWIVTVGITLAWILGMLYLGAVCFRLFNRHWPDTFGELLDWIFESPESSEEEQEL
jgi:hypothetical protein